MTRSAARTLYCAIDGVDLEVVELLKAATGLTTDGNLVRAALYRLAVSAQIGAIPKGAFALRSERSNKRKRQPKRPRIYQQPKLPSMTHPWRGAR